MPLYVKRYAFEWRCEDQHRSRTQITNNWWHTHTPTRGPTLLNVFVYLHVHTWRHSRNNKMWKLRNVSISSLIISILENSGGTAAGSQLPRERESEKGGGCREKSLIKLKLNLYRYRAHRAHYYAYSISFVDSGFSTNGKTSSWKFSHRKMWCRNDATIKYCSR